MRILLSTAYTSNYLDRKCFKQKYPTKPHENTLPTQNNAKAKLLY